MIWIDIVLIAIILIATIIGLAKGFFDSVLSLFGTGLALVGAFYAGKPVATFLDKILKVSTHVKDLLLKWGVINANNEVRILTKVYTGEKAAEFVTILLSIIVVFLLIKLVIWLLAKLFDSATSNSSALSGINRLLGLIFGFAKGVLVVGVVLAITSLVSNVAFSSQIQAEIAKTQITKEVYKYVDDWMDDVLQKQIEKWLDKGEEPTEETPSGEENEPVTSATPRLVLSEDLLRVLPVYSTAEILSLSI